MTIEGPIGGRVTRARPGEIADDSEQGRRQRSRSTLTPIHGVFTDRDTGENGGSSYCCRSMMASDPLRLLFPGVS